MSKATIKANVITVTGAAPALVDVYLAQAEEAIIDRLYPWANDNDANEVRSLPKKYEKLCEQIAIYLVNKQGAEGQLIHMENGIHRHYETGDIPDSMLARVVPLCRVIGG